MKAFKNHKEFEATHQALPKGAHRITVTDKASGKQVGEFEGGTIDYARILLANAGYELEGSKDGHHTTLLGSTG